MNPVTLWIRGISSIPPCRRVRENLEIFRYVDTAGKTDYYNRSGHTVRKTLLKTPINGAYITSSFGRRTHPITGYNSFHKGVDFGAPRGTAIKTSGDGTVIYVGYNNVLRQPCDGPAT